MKKTYLVLLLFSNIAFSQLQQKPLQAEIDSFSMSPLTAQKLDSFRLRLKNNPELIGWTKYYHYKGLLKLHLGEFDSVIHFQNRAISHFNSSEIKRDIDERKLVESYLYLGKSYLEKKDYSNALIKLQNALELSKKHPYKWKSFILVDIAECHLQLGDNQTAVNYYIRGLQDSLFRTLDRPFIIANNRIGVIYLEELKQKDSAKYYLQQALKRSKNSDFKSSLSGIHSNLGNLYVKSSQVDSAIHHFSLQKIAYDDYQPNYPYAKFFALVSDSYVQIEKGNLEGARENLNTVNDSLKNLHQYNRNERDLYEGVLNNFINYYRKKNEPLKALMKSEEKAQLFQTFNKQILEQKIADLEIEFQSKQKDESIKRLEQTTQIQQSLIRQKNILSLVFGALILVTSISTFLFFRQRSLKNKYEKINLEQRLLQSQMSPHFIYNALSSISGLVTKNSDKTIAYISRFSSLLRLTLSNSREDFVLLEDEIQSLNDYLALQSDFGNTFKYDISCEDSINSKNIFLPPMFIQPFIENSIRHGLDNNQDGLISVKFSIINGARNIKCVITDNGIGHSRRQNRSNQLINSKHKSVSTEIVRERLKIYQKKFNIKTDLKIEEVESNKRQKPGTRVVVVIPYLKD